jgi:hypothetical protein
MFMQFLIERARRVSLNHGYSPLILLRFGHYEFKYSDGLIEAISIWEVKSACFHSFNVCSAMNPFPLDQSLQNRQLFHPDT